MPGPEFSTFPVAKEDVALVVDDARARGRGRGGPARGRRRAARVDPALRRLHRRPGRRRARSRSPSRCASAPPTAPSPSTRPAPPATPPSPWPPSGAAPSSADVPGIGCGCSTRCPGRAPPLPGGRTHALLAALRGRRRGRSPRTRLVDEVWGPTTSRPTRPRRCRSWSRGPARRPRPTVVERAPTTATGSGWPPTEVDALAAARDAVVGARDAEGHRRPGPGPRPGPRRRSPCPRRGSPADDGPLGRAARRAARRPGPMRRGPRPGAVGPGRPRARRCRCSRPRVRAPTTTASLAALLRVDGRRARRPGGAGALRAAPRRPAPTGSASTRTRRSRRCTRELLAADRPVREGLRFEADLAGRSRRGHPGAPRRVRESRVTSILGPGGLGKTRLAHLLGREAEQPVVHFVELVGVASPRRRRRRGRLGPRRPRLGERPAGAHPRAAQRRPGPDRAAARPGADPADPRQLRARRRGGRRPRRLLVATAADLRVVTTTRAPLGDRRRAGLPAAPARADDAVGAVRAARPAARPGVRLDRPTRYAASCAGSTGCRWPSSWPRPRCG